MIEKHHCGDTTKVFLSPHVPPQTVLNFLVLVQINANNCLCEFKKYHVILLKFMCIEVYSKVHTTEKANGNKSTT